MQVGQNNVDGTGTIRFREFQGTCVAIFVKTMKVTRKLTEMVSTIGCILGLKVCQLMRNLLYRSYSKVSTHTAPRVVLCS